MSEQFLQLTAEPLTAEAFSAFGEVIDHRSADFFYD